uniref:Uncharacterized protein n=1 Tax=Nelumbo nucifera TaxID=4432 RepID=A0A822XS13_NELNU|nr:TPA_asm: hypothetical protein HUJ06_025848 [Nelumbo nucifera]
MTLREQEIERVRKKITSLHRVNKRPNERMRGRKKNDRRKG